MDNIPKIDKELLTRYGMSLGSYSEGGSFYWLPKLEVPGKRFPGANGIDEDQAHIIVSMLETRHEEMIAALQKKHDEHLYGDEYDDRVCKVLSELIDELSTPSPLLVSE